ncbi:(E2-independent) E3 ubiquitin-conjugating enzyme FATS-like [Sebastes umbrosus]|uniref:(E2-independent) E3 ubiquitin-conjugating enzyme FATS-like n=1 Tax=Sebastes umbrosus TaxID=72105 RepID=UPI00189C93F0|nr:(E2-independent) E3 ubiquitin-conjugating enzyme FATS-like [Sebastes umbrosus]
MSVGLRSRTFPSLSTPNINEASSKDVAASLHRNVLSWGVWRGKEKKESVSLRAITHSASSQTADSGSYSGVSNLFRAASVPDVVGRSPKSAFTSITIAVQRTLPSLSTPQDPAYPSTPAQPVIIPTPQKLLKTFRGRASFIPTNTTRVSNCQPDVCRQNPTVVMPNEFGQAYSPADGLAVSDHGKRKAQLVQSSCTEGDRKQDEIGGSLTNLSLQPSYRSCIHLEVPLRSTSSVVFLDKSLFISLVELEGRRTGQPTLHRSTLSVRLGVSSCRRSSTDNKPAQINEGYGRARAAMLGRNKRNGRKSGAGHCRSPLSQHRGYKIEQTAPAHGVNSKAEDSDTQRHSTTLGLLSFRGPSPSNTKAGRQKGNADEAAFPIRSNFRHRQHTSNVGPADSRTWSKQARIDETEEGQQHDCSSEPQEGSDKTQCSRPKADSLEGTAKNLSLKEALELFRPDFISRSQGRVRRLEQRARRRRSLQESNPDLVVRGLGEDRGKQKRNCTTPDPLSDNLFKPRERSISGKEMQLRSRRIYNKLPEVTKKKEEEKKRAVSQTNRLRADVFKKRLLDQILQR